MGFPCASTLMFIPDEVFSDSFKSVMVDYTIIHLSLVSGNKNNIEQPTIYIQNNSVSQYRFTV